MKKGQLVVLTEALKPEHPRFTLLGVGLVIEQIPNSDGLEIWSIDPLILTPAAKQIWSCQTFGLIHALRSELIPFSVYDVRRVGEPMKQKPPAKLEICLMIDSNHPNQIYFRRYYVDEVVHAVDKNNQLESGLLETSPSIGFKFTVDDVSWIRTNESKRPVSGNVLE